VPRGMEALGCRVEATLDGLGEADVVYALRMQRERMTQAFVPSLREYARCYQIGSDRLRPGQLLMHPGPVNRGVELAAEVIDGPSSLITAQVGAGVVVRMAVLFELLATGGGPVPAAERATEGAAV
jgi:aspartate carbamoyltransferase catalytic subunit